MIALSHAVANPWLEFPAIFLLGVIDGVNPCAFSTLIAWLGFLWRSVTKEVYEENSYQNKHKRIMETAMIYAASMGAVYGIFGLGILSFRAVIPPTWVTPMSQFAGLIVIVMGILLVRDAMAANKKAPLVHMPKQFHPLVKKAMQPASKIATAIGGAVIGLCSVPCSGIVYLGVLTVLNEQPAWVRWVGFAIYLLGFLFPIIASASVLSSQSVLINLGRFAIRTRSGMRWAMSFVVLGLGVLAVWMA